MSGSPSFRVRVLDETTSTNDVVKQALAAGEPEGLVVRARRQTAGYGRQGRSWTSPDGGLYLSLLLRPQVDAAVLPTLSLAVGLGVRRALVWFADPSEVDGIRVKWPNDVVSDAGKLCGISLEALNGGVCVGIGVNVLPPDHLPDVGGKNHPAYIAQLGSCLSESSLSKALDLVFAAILAEIEPLYRAWRQDGFETMLDEYNRHASLTGRQVSLVDRTGAEHISGIVRKTDAFGRLIVRAGDGIDVPVSSGEVHII